MMKLLLISVLTIFSMTLAHAESFQVKSVWKAKGSVGSKSYMAVVSEEDNFYGGDKLIIFGKFNDKIKVRYFSLFALNFYTTTGSKFESQDEYYFLKGNVIRKNKLLKVSLENPKGNIFNIVYEKTNSDMARQFAENATAVASQRLYETDRLSSPEYLYQFKRMLIRLKDKMGYFLNEEGDYDLPTFPLQIEQEWPGTIASDAISKATINRSGTDLISKKFKTAKVWTDARSIPEFDNKKYSFYRRKAKAFRTTPLLNGAKKFVRYEIVNVDYFKCGDYIREKVESFIWVLTDGSTFGYSPYLECD